MKIKHYVLLLLCVGATLSLHSQSFIKLPFAQNEFFEVIPTNLDVDIESGKYARLGQDITIKGGSGIYDFTWFLNNEVISTEPSIRITKGGGYTLVINDGGGCEASVYYRVTEDGMQVGAASVFEAEVDVYPNPSNGIFSLKLPQNLRANAIYLHSIDGKMLKSYSLSDINIYDGKMNFNISEFEQGHYLLSILTDEDKYTKLIILK